MEQKYNIIVIIMTDDMIIHNSTDADTPTMPFAFANQTACYHTSLVSLPTPVCTHTQVEGDT